MFKRLRRGGALAAALALAIAALGATPALAIPEDLYESNEVMLTKVIDAPKDTDASNDTYVFHFAGGGDVADGNVEAGQVRDRIYSDGVEQDNTTLKVGDVVPTIADVKLRGVPLTTANSLSDGQTYQTVIQESFDTILNNVVFPHAGVYTYVVTEKSATTTLSGGISINASQAEYMLRIRVENAKTEGDSELTNRELTVKYLTVQQTKDDNGDPFTGTESGKIDPTYPKATDGKITETAVNVRPATDTLAGDLRGRDVPGFTFANEYYKGGSFQVKKLYDGAHSDRTRYSTVELVVYSKAAASPDAQGCCLTYVIEGDGIDLTEDNVDMDGDHWRLNGVYDIPQENHNRAVFNDDGWCYIKADLKEDSVLRITGEFGPYNPSYESESPNHKDRRMTLSTSGLLNGQTFYVIERTPGDYRPTGYVYLGDATDVDPRVSAEGMTVTPRLSSETPDETDYTHADATLMEDNLYLKGQATGSATTVFVVNTMDENKVSVTGVLIDNLPYILMVGVPLAVFAGMFVAKRRGSSAA